MLTTPQEWALMTDGEKYQLLVDIQTDRNNLRAYLRDLVHNPAPAERIPVVIIGKTPRAHARN